MKSYSPKIILVEDNQADAGLVKHAFKSQSIATELIHCSDGEELFSVLPTLLSSTILYILLDLNMPGMNGYEILKRFATGEDWKNLPVIVFSSSKDHSDVCTCYKLGANAYVRKPLDFNEFDETIRSINSFWGEINLRPSYKS